MAVSSGPSILDWRVDLLGPLTIAGLANGRNRVGQTRMEHCRAASARVEDPKGPAKASDEGTQLNRRILQERSFAWRFGVPTGCKVSES
jgi:hypothetical protein